MIEIHLFISLSGDTCGNDDLPDGENQSILGRYVSLTYPYPEIWLDDKVK